jgi:transcriptional regulator with XRE-family HTH domain
MRRGTISRMFLWNWSFARRHFAWRACGFAACGARRCRSPERERKEVTNARAKVEENRADGASLEAREEVRPNPTASLPIILGRRLRQLRRDRCWSQQELASRAGISVAALRGYEHGHPPLLAPLMRLADQFEMDLEELVHGPGANACERAIRQRLPVCRALPPHMGKLLIRLMDTILILHREVTAQGVHLAAATQSTTSRGSIEGECGQPREQEKTKRAETKSDGGE